MADPTPEFFYVCPLCGTTLVKEERIIRDHRANECRKLPVRLEAKDMVAVSKRKPSLDEYDVYRKWPYED